MKGIISRVLEIKALYDNASEAVRQILFKTYEDGTWALRRREGDKFVVYVDLATTDRLIIEGADNNLKVFCELEFVRNSEGDMVPAEYTVWFGSYRSSYRTYHRVF